ncbi:MAG: SH3 domain-containing protein [Anaerolineales bacterium]|nr:SH3 domain-containing protein [Anaerolineales bacterium]
MNSQKETTGRGRLRWAFGIALWLVLGMLLAACGGGATPTQPPIVPPTEPVLVPTAVPPVSPAPGPTAMPLEAQPVVPTAQEGQPSAVANYNTWIYGGPGPDYVVYAAFLGANTAQVVGKTQDGLWWAISVPAAPSQNGWVEGSWVTVSNVDNVSVLPAPPVPPTTDLVPPAAGDPQATALVNTYVRSGPGGTYPAYGVAPAGATARVIGRSSDGAWWVVRLDPSKVGAGYGWVSASTVQASNVDSIPVIEAPPAPPTVPPSAPPAGAAAATASDYVYVRSGAGTCFAAYGVAPPGSTGEIAGKSSDGQWWQVKIPAEFAASGAGWVSAAYVTTANTGNVPAVTTEPCAEVPVPPPGTYACYLQSQTPADYSAMAPDTDFTMTWVLSNTSTETWSNGVLEFIQSGSGGDLHTGSDTIGLASEVAPGGSTTAAVPGRTAGSTGSYGELWQILSGDKTVCEFWMIVNVVE